MSCPYCKKDRARAELELLIKFLDLGLLLVHVRHKHPEQYYLLEESIKRLYTLAKMKGLKQK